MIISAISYATFSLLRVNQIAFFEAKVPDMIVIQAQQQIHYHHPPPSIAVATTTTTATGRSLPITTATTATATAAIAIAIDIVIDIPCCLLCRAGPGERLPRALPATAMPARVTGLIS